MNYKEQAEKQLYSENFDKYDLPDISNIAIKNTDLQNKISSFLEAVKNPYLFRVGDVGVHVSFSGSNGDTLQKRMCNLLLRSI